MCDEIKVTVVGTGSSGNAYIVECQGIKILLDAGMSGNNIRKANGNKLSDIRAAFITHEHKDHAGFILDLIGFGVPIYLPQDCNVFIPEKYKNTIRRVVASDEWVMISGTPIRYRATLQNHDVPCLSYEFDIGCSVLHYVTDTVEIAYPPQPYADHYWICECDYTEKCMAKNEETESAEIAHRNIRTRDNHLSDDYVTNFFKPIENTAVLIVHQSELNFDKQEFKRKAKGICYCLAEKGKSYIFDKNKISEVKV